MGFEKLTPGRLAQGLGEGLKDTFLPKQNPLQGMKPGDLLNPGLAADAVADVTVRSLDNLMQGGFGVVANLITGTLGKIGNVMGWTAKSALHAKVLPVVL